jgi:hypothetical protein
VAGHQKEPLELPDREPEEPEDPEEDLGFALLSTVL